MTSRQRAHDVKVFSEAMKTEAVKLGDYDRDCSAVTAMTIEQEIKELVGALYAANFTATYYHEIVIEKAAAIAALAMSVASSSRRELEAFEHAREAV